MGFFDIADISGSGMSAERFRMDLIANNIANSETTRTEEGGPYKKRNVVFEEKTSSQFATMFSGKLSGGVKVAQVVSDDSTKQVYDPSHPDADANGNVAYPKISVATEMVDMISATRAYEANLNMFNLGKSMAIKSLDIGK